MAKQTLIINSVAELVQKLSAARCGGQYATIYGETTYKVNMYPNGTLPKDRSSENAFNNALYPNPTKGWHIQYHFGADYEKAMAKALGIDSYESDGDNNREHLVPSILMRYISTQNVCAIAMPESRYNDGLFVGGKPATEKQIAYLEQYKQKRSSNAVVPYLTIGVKNITRLVVGGIEYQVKITDTTYTPAPAETYAVVAAY